MKITIEIETSVRPKNGLHLAGYDVRYDPPLERAGHRAGRLYSYVVVLDGAYHAEAEDAARSALIAVLGRVLEELGQQVEDRRRRAGG